MHTQSAKAHVTRARGVRVHSIACYKNGAKIILEVGSIALQRKQTFSCLLTTNFYFSNCMHGIKLNSLFLSRHPVARCMNSLFISSTINFKRTVCKVPQACINWSFEDSEAINLCKRESSIWRISISLTHLSHFIIALKSFNLANLVSPIRVLHYPCRIKTNGNIPLTNFFRNHIFIMEITAQD